MHSEDASESQPERSEEEETASEVESSEEEEEDDDDYDAVRAVRPYAALIESLAVESGPRAKRRKLDHTHQEREGERRNEEQLSENNDAQDDDAVDEAEEGPETATDDFLHDDDDIEDASDPFESHFADPDGNLLSQRLKSLQQSQWDTTKVTLQISGKVLRCVPKSEAPALPNIPETISGPADLKLKQKLSGASIKQRPSFDKLESSLAPFIFNYQDVLFCDRRPANAENLRRLTCLHAVNHIFKLVYLALLSLPRN